MATKEVVKKADIAVDDIFHPLAHLDSQWVTEGETKPQFRNDAKPVLLNDAIYIEGSNSSFDKVIWKYSISRRAWSTIFPPQYADSDNYTIAAYQSQLMLIGGKYNQKPMPKVYKFDEDDGWSEAEGIVIPSSDKMPSPSNITVTSEGKNFVLSWAKDNQFTMLIFDGITWKEVKGPQCERGSYRPNMAILDGTLYISDSYHDSIYSAPLESLGDGPGAWMKLPDLPNTHMLTSGAANLTILNSSCVATIVPSQNSDLPDARDTSYILALEPCSRRWMDLGEIPCFLGHGAAPPKIVGLPSGSAGNEMLLAIGYIRREYKNESGIDPSGFSIPFETVSNKFSVLKVSSTVNAYNPSDRISLRAIMKLEKCTSYKVLIELEKSNRIREMFMDKASFTPTDQIIPTELYPDVKAAAMCIASWLRSTSEATLPPTWENFLCVILKEVNLSLVAKGIEEYLASTVADEVEETNKEQQRTSLEELALTRSELTLLGRCIASVGSHDNIILALNDVEEKFKACSDRYHETFKKLGKEKDDSAQQISQLTEELQKRENELLAQGEHPAKEQETNGEKLTEKCIPTLIKQLKKHASKWREIGIHLGFLPGELKNIESRPNSTSGAPLSWFMAMLEDWIEWAPGDSRGSTDYATLENLRTAMNDAGLGASAQDLSI